MSETAVAIISSVLARGGGPDDVLAELTKGGVAILEPLDAVPPTWLPMNQDSAHLMKTAALLSGEGKHVEEIADELRKSKRQVQRYLAAAVHLRLIDHHPRRRRSKFMIEKVHCRPHSKELD
ncbi:hypothetical protein [Nonomuraea endophytica]|uniref:hypothetical protein n=1 Tax=Nonomuraea endophytica TaxID=714136 RepID=UPI0037C72BB2